MIRYTYTLKTKQLGQSQELPLQGHRVQLQPQVICLALGRVQGGFHLHGVQGPAPYVASATLQDDSGQWHGWAEACWPGRPGRGKQCAGLGFKEEGIQGAVKIALLKAFVFTAGSFAQGIWH